MQNILDSFFKQFNFKPEIINRDRLQKAQLFVIGGMGGSHLSASIIKDEVQAPNIIIHSNYGLPNLTDAQKSQALFIAVSHSGNTEETLDFAKQALAENHPLAVITRGGTLEEFAENNALPFVLLPHDDIPPRFSVGYIAVALLALMGMENKIAELSALTNNLVQANAGIRSEALTVAQKIGPLIPIIYSSEKNQSLAYYLKIMINETSKTPAFTDWFPELNHNEMSGFTLSDSAKPFCLITIEDSDDYPRIQKRMDLTEKIISERGAQAIRLKLAGENRSEKFWRCIALAIQVSLALAEQKKVDPAETLLIENFKRDLNA